MLLSVYKYNCFFFFFFKQKTAYEITRRDWSSDVCSSDLFVAKPHRQAAPVPVAEITNHADRSEERRVGKEWPCCVDLGGRRIIKKKKKKRKNQKLLIDGVESSRIHAL